MNKIGLILLLLLVSGSTSFACTGFYISRDGKIYAGNNEDYNNPNTKMWIIPGDHESYGRIYFGIDNYYPQGGINEKGLFFDGFATQPLPVTKSENKLTYKTSFFFNIIQNEILSTCSNVDEVISFLNKYNLDFLERAMLFFGDDPDATEKATWIAASEAIIKMLLYYFHERAWFQLNLGLDKRKKRKND